MFCFLQCKIRFQKFFPKFGNVFLRHGVDLHWDRLSLKSIGAVGGLMYAGLLSLFSPSYRPGLNAPAVIRPECFADDCYTSGSREVCRNIHGNILMTYTYTVDMHVMRLLVTIVYGTNNQPTTLQQVSTVHVSIAVRHDKCQSKRTSVKAET